MTTITIERAATEPATKPVQRRESRAVKCPSCGHADESAANLVKCSSCGLRAPVSAFSGAVASRTFGEPRAYTIRGNID